MASEDGRAEAALSVLRGVSVAQVADERGVEPDVVLQWVDLFCEGSISGEAIKRAVAGEPRVVSAHTVAGEASASHIAAHSAIPVESRTFA